MNTESNSQRVIGAVLLSLLLVGCGTKGPLVLPDPPVTQSEGANLASVGWGQPAMPFTNSRWVATHPTTADKAPLTAVASNLPLDLLEQHAA